jgi:hypothetical protein
MCREQDVPAIMAFIHDHWAKNHILSRNEALVRWQYDSSLRGDCDGPPSILLAWSGDRIVGMLGLTYMRWLQGGRTYRGAWTSHWFVAPEFRRSQLSLSLIRRAGQLGAELIGSVGINDLAMSLIRNIGYEPIDEIPRWVGVIDPKKTAALIQATTVGLGGDELLTACRGRAIAQRGDQQMLDMWKIAEWTDADADDWNAFWDADLSANFTGPVRDTAHIQWRYLRHPTFQYRVLVARHRSSNVVGGLAVTRMETVKGRTERVLRILELLTNDRSATDALLRHLVSDARDAEVAFADFYCTRRIEGLAEAGFQVEQLQTNRFPIPLRLQPLEPGGRPLNTAVRLPSPVRGSLQQQLSRNELYLTKSDGDQDRPN